MSFDALKSQVESLPAEERRRLLAFIVGLEDSARPDYKQILARKIDDQSAENWLTVEQCERELGLSGDSR